MSSDFVLVGVDRHVTRSPLQMPADTQRISVAGSWKLHVMCELGYEAFHHNVVCSVVLRTFGSIKQATDTFECLITTYTTA